MERKDLALGKMIKDYIGMIKKIYIRVQLKGMEIVKLEKVILIVSLIVK